MIGILRGHELERFWPHIAEQLDNVPETWALWWTKEMLFTQAISGQVQVWGVGTDHEVRLIVFTKVAQYVPTRSLSVFLAFGNSLDEHLPTLDAALTRYAAEMGCDVIEITGREGWGRKLSGFRKLSCIFVREVRREGVH